MSNEWAQSVPTSIIRPSSFVICRWSALLGPFTDGDRQLQHPQLFVQVALGLAEKYLRLIDDIDILVQQWVDFIYRLRDQIQVVANGFDIPPNQGQVLLDGDDVTGVPTHELIDLGLSRLWPNVNTVTSSGTRG